MRVEWKWVVETGSAGEKRSRERRSVHLKKKKPLAGQKRRRTRCECWEEEEGGGLVAAFSLNFFVEKKKKKAACLLLFLLIFFYMFYNTIVFHVTPFPLFIFFILPTRSGMRRCTQKSGTWIIFHKLTWNRFIVIPIK